MDGRAEAASPEQCRALCALVVKLVQDACRKHKGIRRGCSQLCRDLLVMLSGLRPAVLIDYCSAPQIVLLDIVGQLQAAATSYIGKAYYTMDTQQVKSSHGQR